MGRSPAASRPRRSVDVMTWSPRVMPPQLRPPPDILQAVRHAAAGSRTPFATLMSITAAASRQSDASGGGAFQFSEATWLDLVRRHGATAGRPDLAALAMDRSSGPEAAAARQTVLEARRDSGFAARLAAHHCDECRVRLARTLGRQPSEEDVRLAYLLGVRGATTLIAASSATPQAGVHVLLPGAFARNRAVLSQHETPLTAQQAVAGLKARFALEIAQTEAAQRYAEGAALSTPQGRASGSAR